MMRNKRIVLAAILIFTLLLFSGCSQKNPTDPNTPNGTNSTDNMDNMDNDVNKTSDGAMKEQY
ncbi:MAG: hypothetical protein RR131_01120 [Anaerovorax sp.]